MKRMAVGTFLGLAVLARIAMAATVTVNTNNFVQDALTSSDIPTLIANPGPDGVISLREAVRAANISAGADLINFAGDYTILLTVDVPSINDPAGTTIDGTGHAVVIDGNARVRSGPTMAMTSNSHIRNLTLVNCRYGVTITLSTGCSVTGCTIGVGGANTRGVYVYTGASGAVIGGTSPAEANLISGNVEGLVITDGAINTLVQGNRIGTDAAGAAAMPNTVSGITISRGAQGTVVGGAGTAANLISGNASGDLLNPAAGIRIDRAAGNDPSGNTILGNLIGTDAAGTSALPNDIGVYVLAGATTNTIGGASPNTIAYNGTGVRVSGAATAGIRVTRNSIYANDDGDGLTADGIRLDGGANASMAPPVIVAAASVVSGTAPANATVEIFSDTAAQGRTFIESAAANGAGMFTGAVEVSGYPYEGKNVTATATDAAGNTSQFSAPVAVPMTPPAVQSIQLLDATPTNAAQVRFLVTFSEPVASIETGATPPFDDFALTLDPGGTLVDADVVEVSGAGAVYTITVAAGTGAGPVRLDVLASGGVQDLSGNPLGGNYTSGPSYTLDREPPAVQAITLIDPTPTNWAEVSFAITFSEPVLGIEVDPADTFNDFALEAGGGLTGAAITSVTGSDAAYVVRVDTGSGDGTLRLDVRAAGAAHDALGNPLSADYTSGPAYTLQHMAFTQDLPEALDAVENDSVTFQVGVQGGFASLHYQWYKEDGGKAEVPGAPDAPVFSIAHVALSDAGRYYVEVSDGNEMIRSGSAELTVRAQVPALGLGMLAVLAVLLAITARGRRRTLHGRI